MWDAGSRSLQTFPSSVSCRRTSDRSLHTDLRTPARVLRFSPPWSLCWRQAASPPPPPGWAGVRGSPGVGQACGPLRVRGWPNRSWLKSLQGTVGVQDGNSARTEAQVNERVRWLQGGV